MHKSSTLLLATLFTTLAAVSGVQAQSLGTAAANPAASLSIAQRADLTRRLELASRAVMLNPPKDAILQSNLASHPMFQQVFARLDADRLNRQATELMAQTFSADELQALLNFGNSPAGRRFLQKMPSYQQLLGAMLQNEMTAAFQAYVTTQASQGASGLNASGLGSTPLPTMPTGMPAGAAVPVVAPAGLNGAGTPIR